MKPICDLRELFNPIPQVSIFEDGGTKRCTITYSCKLTSHLWGKLIGLFMVPGIHGKYQVRVWIAGCHRVCLSD